MYLRCEDNHPRRCCAELHLYDTSILVGWIYHYESSSMVVPGTASGSILFVGHLGALGSVVLVAELLPSSHRAVRALYKEGSLFDYTKLWLWSWQRAWMSLQLALSIYLTALPAGNLILTLLQRFFVYTGQT